MEQKMFCYQCEQTAGCTGCTGNRGVCGKTAQTAQLQDELTGAFNWFSTSNRWRYAGNRRNLERHDYRLVCNADQCQL